MEWVNAIPVSGRPAIPNNAHQASSLPRETVPPISVNHCICRLTVCARAGLGFQQRTGREVDFARARAAPLRSRVDEVDSDRN